MNLKTRTLTSILTALALPLMLACEPAPGGDGAEISDESGDAILGTSVNCTDVLDLIGNPNPGTFSMANFTYVDHNFVAAAFAPITTSSANSADTTFTNLVTRAYNSTPADRATFNVRRTFLNLRGSLLETSPRVTVNIFRASSGISYASFDVGVTECSVNGSEATIAASTAGDGRLVVRIYGQVIGG